MFRGTGRLFPAYWGYEALIADSVSALTPLPFLLIAIAAAALCIPLTWWVLKDVEDISILRLTESDVVRHVLVQRIIKAYEIDEERRNKKNRP